MVESGNLCPVLEGIFYISSVATEVPDFTEIVVFQPKKNHYQSSSETLISLVRIVINYSYLPRTTEC